jgi:hypothetical protein
MNWDEQKALVTALLDRTRSGEVNWQQSRRVDDSSGASCIEYCVEFNDVTLYVGNVWPAGQEAVRIRLERTDGLAVFDLTATNGSESWSLFKSLLDSAEASVLPASEIMKQLLKTVRESGQVGLTAEDKERTMAQEFFAIAEGEWHLKYGDGHSVLRGSEHLKISSDGKYYFDKPGIGFIHTFNLEHVLFDPSTLHVSFDKVYSGVNDPTNRPAGRLHFREILDITADKSTMVGYAEKDRHPLMYRRVVAAAK